MNKLYSSLRYHIDKTISRVLRTANRITKGRAAGMMFIENVDVKHIETNVKIISESEDSIEIAKVDESGHIVNDDFRILATTDLHMFDNNEMRNKCMSMLYKQINATKPDLVVLTGDVITTKFQHFDAIQFAEFMEEIGIYWCYTFGNHEAREFDSTFKRLILDMMMRYPHCLSRFGKKSVPGCSNFCINILKSNYEIKRSLFVLDSGRDITDESRRKYLANDKVMAKYGLTNESADGGEYQQSPRIYGYDFIKPEQIRWYEDKLNELSNLYRLPTGLTSENKMPKSFIFMHIPINEYKNIIEPDGNGSFRFREGANVLYGGCFESVGCSPVNSGLFKKAKELGSTEAFFSGHDHVNDFDGVYEGIHLVYLQYNGYETYTPKTPEKEWMHGVTIIDLDKGEGFRISQRFNRMYL